MTDMKPPVDAVDEKTVAFLEKSYSLEPSSWLTEFEDALKARDTHGRPYVYNAEAVGRFLVNKQKPIRPLVLSVPQKQMLDEFAKVLGRELTTFYKVEFKTLFIYIYKRYGGKLPFDGNKFKIMSFKNAWNILQISWSLNTYGVPVFNKDDYASIQFFEKKTGVLVNDLTREDLASSCAEDWGLQPDDVGTAVLFSLIQRARCVPIHRNAQGIATHPDEVHPEIQRSWEQRMQIEGSPNAAADEVTSETEDATEDSTAAVPVAKPAAVVAVVKPAVSATIPPPAKPAGSAAIPPPAKPAGSADDMRWRVTDTPGGDDHDTPGNPELDERKDRCQFRCNCRFGLSCLKEHTIEEERVFRLKELLGQRHIKASMCKHFLSSKGCARPADQCRFAHGESDSVCEICGSCGHSRLNCKQGEERLKMALERKGKAERMLK